MTPLHYHETVKKETVKSFRSVCFVLLSLVLPLFSISAQEISVQQYMLKEKIVEDFEGPAARAWDVSIINGTAAQTKTALRSNGNAYDFESERASGVKITTPMVTDYIFHIVPPEAPLALGKKIKTISLFAHGYNNDHRLHLLLNNKRGTNQVELPLGKLNYWGWKNLTVAVPNIFGIDDELILEGFVLYLHPLELGTEPYYFYFDHITAVGEFQ